jgi:hypothetical protein
VQGAEAKDKLYFTCFIAKSIIFCLCTFENYLRASEFFVLESSRIGVNLGKKRKERKILPLKNKNKCKNREEKEQQQQQQQW